jgi:hypothetical protein
VARRRPTVFFINGSSMDSKSAKKLIGRLANVQMRVSPAGK